MRVQFSCRLPLLTVSPSTRLKNIEETEKAKRQISEMRKERSRQADDEAHLAAARCTYIIPFLSLCCLEHTCLSSRLVYRPNLKAKSDADIMRDAKLEAMGLRPDDHEYRRPSDRAQMATDEMVSSFTP